MEYDVTKSVSSSLEGMMLKLKLQYFGHLMRRVDSLEKTLMLGGTGGKRRRGWDEMAGWHHWLDGRESQWTPGVGDGQGGLACCYSWGRKESGTTELKSLLKELLIMFSSRWVRRVNLHFMLFILMGERSSSSNQSIVMNVFRDIQRFFQGVGFGRTAGNSPNLPFSHSVAWFNTHHPTLSPETYIQSP